MRLSKRSKAVILYSKHITSHCAPRVNITFYSELQQTYCYVQTYSCFYAIWHERMHRAGDTIDVDLSIQKNV